MTHDNHLVVTEEGLLSIKNELENRKSEIRNKIAEDIELARQQGDLSENAAYKAAMEAKEFNENRIQELENMIKTVIVKKTNPKNTKIDIGEEFCLIRLDNKQSINYKLVGSNESNPREGKLSIISPLGKLVLGKNFGDTIKMQLPNGEVEYKIEETK